MLSGRATALAHAIAKTVKNGGTGSKQQQPAKAEDIKRVVNETNLMAKGLREQAKVLQSAGHNLETKKQPPVSQSVRQQNQTPKENQENKPPQKEQKSRSN